MWILGVIDWRRSSAELKPRLHRVNCSSRTLVNGVSLESFGQFHTRRAFIFRDNEMPFHTV